MSVKILYGSSVSGRENEIYRRILFLARQNPDQRYIMMVPEQASLTVQEKLVSLAENQIILNVDVLTFSRLCYRVFSDTDTGELRTLTDFGKTMLLRKVVREHDSEIRFLRRNMKAKGFFDELKSVFSEFAQYGITPSMMKEKMEGKSLNGMKEKMTELLLLYGYFLSEVHEKYELFEERLQKLAKALEKWEPLGRTHFYFDGFTGFTPPQSHVISVLMQKAPSLFFGIDFGSSEKPEGNKQPEDLFYMSARMADNIIRLAAENQKKTEEEWMDGVTNAYCDEVLHIEKNLFRYPVQLFPAETDRVRIVRAPKKSDEVRNVVSEILRARKEGYAYRDMAVVLGALDSYREEIHAAFQAAGISYFLDETRDLTKNPLFLFILCLLKIAEKNFLPDDVIAILQNRFSVSYLSRLDFSDELYTPYELLNETGNYIREFSLRGSGKYEQEWTRKYRHFSEDRLPLLNRIRETVFSPILSFYEKMRGKETAAERIAALREILGEFRVREILAEMAESADNVYTRLEYEKTWTYVNRVLSECGEILKDTPIATDTFKEIIMSGFESVFVGMAPPSKDEVTVGDLRRTRLSDVKKLFVIGANESALPAVKSGGGLLNDHDRELLLSENVLLANTVRQDSFDSQFYLYLLLTVPTDSLYLSYSLCNSDGKAITPSYVVAMIRSLFPHCQEITYDEKDLLSANTDEEALSLMAQDLREALFDLFHGKKRSGEDNRRYLALTEYFQTKKDSAEWYEWVLRGLFLRYKEADLSEKTADELYENRTRISATQLEKYAGCAFSHFLRYGLLIHENGEFKVDSRDTGNFLHHCLEKYFKTLADRGKLFTDLTEKEEEQVLSDVVKTEAEYYDNRKFKESNKTEYLVARSSRILLRSIRNLKEHWNEGSYRELRTEVPFSGEELSEFRFALKEGLSCVLDGRIDRIDLAEDGQSVYVKVIDYKSSSKKFDLSKIEAGTQLQLLLYLRAAEELMKKEKPEKKIIPAGVYYYQVHDPIVDVKELSKVEDLPELLRSEQLLNGFTNNDPAAVTCLGVTEPGTAKIAKGVSLKKNGELKKTSNNLSTAELRDFSDGALRLAKDFSEKIFSGKIPVNPLNAETCRYCNYRSVCGFDRTVNGYQYREKGGTEDGTDD